MLLKDLYCVLPSKVSVIVDYPTDDNFRKLYTGKAHNIPPQLLFSRVTRMYPYDKDSLIIVLD